jgi:hypothetical protein
MHFVVIASTVFVVLGVVTAFVASRVLNRLTVSWRLTLYQLCLALSLGPFVLHVSYVFQTARWSYFSTAEPFGFYPGLIIFVGVSLLLGLGLLGISMKVARSFPLLSALLPAAAFASYFYLAFRLFLQCADPDGALNIDNVATVWLFILEAGATAFLFILACCSLIKWSSLQL